MRGEIQDLAGGAGQLVDEALSLEKQQEQILMNKLATNGRLPPKPQTTFLQKKLQQRKFFDSGDYAMNKDKAKKPEADLPIASAEVLAHKLPSVSEKIRERQLSVDLTPSSDESLQIPRPDTVPQRKSSIIYPSVHSKLSPQPHIHHSHDDHLLEA